MDYTTVNDNVMSEIVELQNKLASSNAPIELKEQTMKTIQRLERMARLDKYR